MPNAPIAQRRFTIGKHGTRYLELFIYAPTKDQEDYRCEYEIREHGGTTREGHALGVDSLQAMILALQKAGADIAFSHHAKSGNLYWNTQNDDLGVLLPKGIES